MPRLLAEIKRTFDRDASDTYMGFFRRLCAVDLLVLDDLGAEKQTEWVLEQLYSIVNERWQDRRSIVVTTQHPRPRPGRPGPHAARERARAARRGASGARRRARPRRAAAASLERVERVAAQVGELEVDGDSTRSCGCGGRSARARCRA